MNRHHAHFPKEEIQMANKYRKRCSTPPVVRETQSETTDATSRPSEGLLSNKDTARAAEGGGRDPHTLLEGRDTVRSPCKTLLWSGKSTRQSRGPGSHLTPSGLTRPQRVPAYRRLRVPDPRGKHCATVNRKPPGPVTVPHH